MKSASQVRSIASRCFLRVPDAVECFLLVPDAISGSSAGSFQLGYIAGGMRKASGRISLVCSFHTQPVV